MKVGMGLLAALLAGSIVGCQDPADGPWQSQDFSIKNGSADTTTAHQAVLALRNDALAGWCTATLIAPRVVLTAAHCVDQAQPSELDVYVTDNYSTSPGTAYPAIEVLQHTQWDGMVTNDIALLRLGTDPAGVVPIPALPAALAITNTDLNQDLDFVGFGLTETGSKGQKLHALSPLELVCTTSTGCMSSVGKKVPNKVICYDLRDGGICDGDSGGPGFVVRGGKEYVAGVTSFANDTCARSVFACSTKVDAFATFIGDFVGQTLPDGAACSDGTQCESSFCVNTVCCNSVCDGPCEVCNKAGSVGACGAAPDATSCPPVDACASGTCQAGDCVAGNPIDCNDQNPCTTDQCNAVSGCLHAPLDCNDQNPCTQDSCNPATGCVSTPVAEDTPCPSGVCRSGACVPTSECPVGGCNDGNPCTEDLCVAQGCAFPPVVDKSPCGECAECQAGICTPQPQTCSAPGGGGGGCQTAGDAGQLPLLLLCALAIIRRFTTTSIATTSSRL